MSRRKKQQEENLRLGIAFFVLVGILVLMSLGFKVADVLRNSTFDGSNKFNLLILKGDPQILSFTPSSSSVFILNTKDYKYKDLGRSLLIPIDAKLEGGTELKKEDLTSNLLSLFLTINSAKTNLTVVDILRLSFFTRSIEKKSKVERTINKDTTALEIQGILQNYFSDPKIVDEKLRIEVINATDVPGLANRLASYITNMGGNVILLSTSDTLKDRSEIRYFDDKSYTVSKLEKLLGFKTEKFSKKGISDVIIVIGKDKVHALPF